MSVVSLSFARLSHVVEFDTYAAWVAACAL